MTLREYATTKSYIKQTFCEDLCRKTCGDPRQYAEATGESLPASGAGLAAQAENEEAQILLVRQEGMDTGELLSELLRNPRVLSAEPNYVMSFAADEELTTEDVGGVAVDDGTATGEGAVAESDGPAEEGAEAAPEAESAADPALAPAADPAPIPAADPAPAVDPA